jgi:hypothetical protein
VPSTQYEVLRTVPAVHLEVDGVTVTKQARRALSVLSCLVLPCLVLTCLDSQPLLRILVWVSFGGPTEEKRPMHTTPDPQPVNHSPAFEVACKLQPLNASTAKPILSGRPGPGPSPRTRTDEERGVVIKYCRSVFRD